MLWLVRLISPSNESTKTVEQIESQSSVVTLINRRTVSKTYHYTGLFINYFVSSQCVPRHRTITTRRRVNEAYDVDIFILGLFDAIIHPAGVSWHRSLLPIHWRQAENNQRIFPGRWWWITHSRFIQPRRQFHVSHIADGPFN